MIPLVVQLPCLIWGRLDKKAVEYYKFIEEHSKTLESLKRSAKVISFVNHKGGCSKTTSVYTIASLLEKQGNKVLLVDLDPQGNATSGLGIDKNNLDTLVEIDFIFAKARYAKDIDAIKPEIGEYVDFIENVRT